MKHRYKIKNILHSGAKGERGSSVSDDKYDYMINAIVFFNIDELKNGESLMFWFENHPFHKWWMTSTVKDHEFLEDGQILIVETMNTIYTFLDLGEFVFERKVEMPDCLRGEICV